MISSQMFLLLLGRVIAETAPEPWGALPTQGQLQYHREELAAFIHFGVNTFTNSEWGSGTEDPNVFKPTNLDCDQWVSVLKQAGFKRIIMIGRHHDGFCLWKSKFTEQDVENSVDFQARSLELGQSGDVFIELSKACTKYDMGMGFYLSPWDANSDYYGDPNDNYAAYNRYYMNQLEEILGNSTFGNGGRFVEVWMDGAKGSGAEYQEYWFEEWFALIERLQPGAVVFSPYGSTVRWIGNENGKAGYPCYSKLNRTRQRNWYDTHGGDENAYLQVGDPNGDIWSVGECDVSLTTGWFWHENRPPKSMEELTDIYFKSVGRGQPWLLNVAPNREGRFPDEYVDRVLELGETIRRTFENNLALADGVTAKASEERGPSYSAAKVLDNNTETFWAMNDNSRTGWLEVNLGKMTMFDIISISEHIPLGQRVNAFTVQIHTTSGWVPHSEEKTIGAKRLIRGNAVTADAIRFNFTDCSAVPIIESVGVYKAYGAFVMGDGLPDGLNKVPYNNLDKVGTWTEDGEGFLVSSAKGDSLSKSIDGTKFWILGTVDPSYGDVTISIDGEVVETVSLHSETRVSRQIIFESQELLGNNGNTHTLKVTAASDKPVGVSSFYALNNGQAGMFELASTTYDVDKGKLVTLTVKRVAGSSGATSVRFETAPNTAVHGRHYIDVGVDLQFGEGETYKQVTVETVNHTETVGNLTFYGQISQPTGSAIVGFNKSALVTIVPVLPTPTPTPAPTQKPTTAPTQKPTTAPTQKPTSGPTQKPTSGPTQKPTLTPEPEPAGGGGTDTKKVVGILVGVLVVLIVIAVVLAVLVIRKRRQRKMESETSTRMTLL